MPISVRRSGFSLVEISIVLVVVATMLAGVLPAITESAKVRAVDQTADRMKEIEDSLQAYFAANSALPCPSDITQAVNNANFGKKAANATCQGGTPAANWGPVNAAGAAGNVVGGGVPTKDLGLPDEVAFDGWGHRFAYHVDRTATVAGTFATSGAITVNGTGGALRSSTAVYALISAGKNGHGGYGRAASRFDAGSTNADEWSNCQSVAATCGGAPASYNATFVQRLEQADSAAPTNKFDDLVVYKLRGHLTAGGGGSSFWAGSGSDIYNTNSGNVGVGTTAPAQKFHISGNAAGGGNQTGAQIGDVGAGSGPLFLIHNSPQIRGNSYYNAGNYYGGGTAKPGVIDFANGLHFQTSNNAVGAAGAAVTDLVESMTILPSGNVGIGTTGATAAFNINGANQNGASNPLFRINDTALPGSYFAIDNGATASAYRIVSAGASARNIELQAGTASNQFVLNTSGNVGIGTTGPYRKLHVVGGNAPFLLSTADYNNTNTGSAFVAEFGAASGNTYSMLGALSSGGTAWNNLVLNPGGNVGIGAYGPTYKLDVTGNIRATTGGFFDSVAVGSCPWAACPLSYETIQLNAAHNLRINFSGADKFLFANSGDAQKPGGGSWSAISDARLKTVKSPYAIGLKEINHLNPVVYRYKEGNVRQLPSDRDYVGLIAQDVKPYLPEAVSKQDDGYYALDPSSIMYALVNSVKELDAKIEAGRDNGMESEAKVRSSIDIKPKSFDGQLVFNALMGVGLIGLYLRGAKRR